MSTCILNLYVTVLEWLWHMSEKPVDYTWTLMCNNIRHHVRSQIAWTLNTQATRIYSRLLNRLCEYEHQLDPAMYIGYIPHPDDMAALAADNQAWWDNVEQADKARDAEMKAEEEAERRAMQRAAKIEAGIDMDGDEPFGPDDDRETDQDCPHEWVDGVLVLL